MTITEVIDVTGGRPLVRNSRIPDDAEVDPLRIVEQLPVVSVPIRSLIPIFYLRRAGTDASHVRLLADAASSAKLPPILVQKSSSGIIDGMHRVEAAKVRGEPTIRARLVDCTDEEALVLAVKTNTLHGLPLSRADRIAGAKRIIANHPDWSDRVLAGVTGLSAKAIASLRSSATDPAQLHVKRLGRDGRRRPVVPGEGRRRAAEYINTHPEASLREIARATDVSLGTVHGVRERIRRGAYHGMEKPEQPVGQAADSSTNGVVVNLPQSAPGLRVASGPPNIQPLAWSTISAKLAGDPTLRYSEGGRAFLQWMAAHSTRADEWLEFVDAIPQRWLGKIHQVAVGMSDEWRQFAEQLGRKQGTTS